MPSKIYCIEKANSIQSTTSPDNFIIQNQNRIVPKRVNLVSIKMVKEQSILYANRKITSPSDAVDLLKEFIENSDREILLVCCLDTKNQPTCINMVSVGTLNSSLVHPREVFKPAILGNSSSIIVAHNHPSGDSTPSNEDINITGRLKDAGKIIGIEVIDHLIIGNNTFTSLKQEGVI